MNESNEKKFSILRKYKFLLVEYREMFLTNQMTNEYHEHYAKELLFIHWQMNKYFKINSMQRKSYTMDNLEILLSLCGDIEEEFRLDPKNNQHVKEFDMLLAPVVNAVKREEVDLQNAIKLEKQRKQFGIGV